MSLEPQALTPQALIWASSGLTLLKASGLEEHLGSVITCDVGTCLRLTRAGLTTEVVLGMFAV